MKNRKTHKNVVMAAALVALISFAGSAYAQETDVNKEKMRLMAAGITYSEEGNYTAAKKAYEDLLKLAPNDARIQQRLAEVNAKLAETNAKTSAALDAAKPAEVAPAEEAVVAPAEEAAEVAAEATAEVDPADEAMLTAQHKQGLSIAAARDLIDQAYAKADVEAFDEATELLSRAEAKLPTAKSADPVREQIRSARADFAQDQAYIAMNKRDSAGAKKFAAIYVENAPTVKAGEKFQAKVEKFAANPRNNPLSVTSPDYVVRTERIDELLDKGRAQYLYGNYQGATSTYRTALAIDANNVEATAYLQLISKKMSERAKIAKTQVREELLRQVDDIWALPRIINKGGDTSDIITDIDPVTEKLKKIVIPEVSFPEPGIPLADALATLSTLSEMYDKSDRGTKGVNIVARDLGEAKNVSIMVRNLTLEQILNVVTRNVGCQHDVEDGIVVVSKSKTTTVLYETEPFPLGPSTLTRIIGPSAASDGGGTGDDIFGGGAAAPVAAGGGDDTTKKIQGFLERTGVDFGVGTSVAFDGTTLFVTNSPKNIQKIRQILMRYKDISQVEIEARFMEVNQGTLKELNFNWNVSNADGNQIFGTFTRSFNRDSGTWSTNGFTNRNLATAFSPNQASQPITITQAANAGGDGSFQNVNQLIPTLPATINLAPDASNMINTIVGTINGYNIDLIVDAIEQETGSDLLCSPKITVMDQHPAMITVAQEMWYPSEWDEVRSEVGSGNNDNDSSSAGVTITPGTPRNFVKRDVGVTMEVLPTVDPNDGSITLDFTSIKVTEFEGFMEYGGVAVAISGNTTVTVPPGFVQPVFSVREVKTKVTIFDGATVVLGGLTREEVKTINDRVPVLGDVPLIGRFFQSKAETRQKRNLLIFITSNRITAGGSPVNEEIGGIAPGSVYQQSRVVSPEGTIYRGAEITSSNE